MFRAMFLDDMAESVDLAAHAVLDAIEETTPDSEDSQPLA